MPLTNSNRFRHRNDLPDELSGRFASERQGSFNFRVLRKVFCVWQIERAATCVEPIRALLSALKCVGDLMNIAQVECCRVNEHAISFFSSDVKSPQGRFCESVFYGDTFVGIVADRAKIVIRCDQQDTWSTAIETHDRAVAELSTIETNLVLANTRRP